MKKIEKHIKAILCIVMAAAFFSACGLKDGTDTKANTEGIDVNKISNGSFSVTVPDSWEGKYVTILDDESIQLYQKAAYESFGGGWLCSFEEFNDNGYKELPNYEVLMSGGKTDAETNQVLDEQTYIVMYPSDVQADLEDEKSTSEYFEMFDQLTQVAESFVLDN